MRKNFIKELTEAAISTTDLALNVEGMSEAIQSMIEKITNIKTKDLAVLVKKIKYDNDIAKADEFNQNIGGKLDQLIQSMTEIKGEIDNVTVSMLNGEDVMGGEEDDSMGDFEADFGEFDASAEEEPMDDEEGAMDGSLADMASIGREEK
jgi:hypothetical protein